MSDLRKLIAAALASSNLASSEVSETAIDRIGAMAFTDPLGSALWRLRLAHSQQAFQRALHEMHRRSARVAPDPGFRRRLCEMVLREWMDRNCRACLGRGSRADENQVRKPCTACEGTGLRRYSDVWRMEQLGLDRRAYAKWERRIALLHDRLAAVDAAVYVEIAQQLERIAPREPAKVLRFPGRVYQNRCASHDPELSTATG